jgi:hypothetical protein
MTATAARPTTQSAPPAACIHQIGPFPSDPNIRSLPCLCCGKPIKLYADPLSCSICGGFAPFGEYCVSHDPRANVS